MKLKLDYYIFNYFLYFKLIIINSYSNIEYIYNKLIINKDIMKISTYIFFRIIINNINNIVTL